MFEQAQDLEIEIVVGASWPGEQARGTTGVIAKMGGQTILWYTRRQDTSSLSISEAEYIAAAEGAKDASWLRQLLHEMKIRPTNQAIPLYMDNMAAQQLSQDGSYRRRTRHLDNRYHYIQDQVCKKHLIVIGIPEKENPADAMTKLISMQCLKSWMGSIGITDKTGGLM
jgi:hypothetical protein